MAESNWTEPRINYEASDPVTPTIFNTLGENEKYLNEKKHELKKQSTGGVKSVVKKTTLVEETYAYRPKVEDDNGNLTDLPIEAETAVKLKTARSIGLSGVSATSQSFNGTSAITIPITAVPSTLLTGTNSLNVGSATKLLHEWINLTPGTSILPFGTYLIKVDIADGSCGIGNHGTIITDIINMQADSLNLYTYYSYDLPAGPIHTYCANNYEAKWFRSARIKITRTYTTGFMINLFVSTAGIYETSNVTGAMLYPSKLASEITNLTYQIHYKRIM